MKIKAICKNRIATLICCGCLFIAAAVSAGCQSSIGGQTLPSPYYLKDDIQYFPKGPEFKLQREADALRRARGADGTF